MFRLLPRSQQNLHFRVNCTVSCFYLLPHGSIKASDPVLPLHFTHNLYNPPKNLASSETMSALGCILGCLWNEAYVLARTTGTMLSSLVVMCWCVMRTCGTDVPDCISLLPLSEADERGRRRPTGPLKPHRASILRALMRTLAASELMPRHH